MEAEVGIEKQRQDREKHGVGIEGIWGKDRRKQREEVNRYERAIFIKKIARGMFGTIIFSNFE